MSPHGFHAITSLSPSYAWLIITSFPFPNPKPIVIHRSSTQSVYCTTHEVTHAFGYKFYIALLYNAYAY